MASVFVPDLSAFSVSYKCPLSGACSSANDVSLLFFRSEGRLLAGTRVYRFTRGDIFLLPPQTAAYLYAREDERCADLLSLPVGILRALTPQVILKSANGGASFAVDAKEIEKVVALLATVEYGSSDPLTIFALLHVLSCA